MEEYKKKIKKTIDRFYVECIDEFKEAELRIANDSKFRTMFRKKDYKGNIELLRKCKKNTSSLRFPMGDIPKDDELTKDLVRQAEVCFRQFSRLCDSYIQMQTALDGKSQGKDLPYSKYKEVYYKTQEDNQAMNRELKELDLLYTDFLDDEDYDVYEFID